MDFQEGVRRRRMVRYRLVVVHRGRWWPRGAEAALREAREELGVVASFLPEIGAHPLMVSQTTTVGVSAGHADVCLGYLVEGDAETALEGDVREFAGFRWWTFDEVLAADAAILDPHLQRFAAKLVDRLARLARRGRDAPGTAAGHAERTDGEMSEVIRLRDGRRPWSSLPTQSRVLVSSPTI
jgi:hypothetical protein